MLTTKQDMLQQRAGAYYTRGQAHAGALPIVTWKVQFVHIIQWNFFQLLTSHMANM